jgi:two-component system response regulator NreC
MADGIKSMLPFHNEDLEVYQTEQELLEKLGKSQVRLLFMEYSFSGHGTDNFISFLKRKYRRLRIAVWTPIPLQPQAAARFIVAGADSFVFLRDSKDKLQAYFKGIVEGVRHCPRHIRQIAEDTGMNINYHGITAKEAEVLRYCLANYRNSEIADKLCISLSTLRTHKNRLFKKAGGNKYPDLLRLAISTNIIALEELQDILYGQDR